MAHPPRLAPLLQRCVVYVLEDFSAPLASIQDGYDDSGETLDLLSVIADEGTEDD